MGYLFFALVILFIVVSAAMILIILVQRPQGGGLAGAFGGAGGGSTDTVFGGRVGDALTWATVVAFAVYLTLAVTLNLVPIRGGGDADPTEQGVGAVDGMEVPLPESPEPGATPPIQSDAGEGDVFDPGQGGVDPGADDQFE
jgi:preprotein translocase subunit SecG